MKVKNPPLGTFWLLYITLKLLYHPFHFPPKIFHISTKSRFRTTKEIEVSFGGIKRNLCTNFGVGFRPRDYKTMSFRDYIRNEVWKRRFGIFEVISRVCLVGFSMESQKFMGSKYQAERLST